MGLKGSRSSCTQHPAKRDRSYEAVEKSEEGTDGEDPNSRCPSPNDPGATLAQPSGTKDKKAGVATGPFPSFRLFYLHRCLSAVQAKFFTLHLDSFQWTRLGLCRETPPCKHGFVAPKLPPRLLM